MPALIPDDDEELNSTRRRYTKADNSVVVATDSSMSLLPFLIPTSTHHADRRQ